MDKQQYLSKENGILGKTIPLFLQRSVEVLNHNAPLVVCVHVVRPLDRDPLKADGSFKTLTCSLTEEAANTSKRNTQTTAESSSGGEISRVTNYCYLYI